MSGLFGGGGSTAPATTYVPAPTPKQEDASAQNAASFQKLRRRLAFDRGDTMLTDSRAMGAAPVQRKTLLGE